MDPFIDGAPCGYARACAGYVVYGADRVAGERYRAAYACGSGQAAELSAALQVRQHPAVRCGQQAGGHPTFLYKSAAE